MKKTNRQKELIRIILILIATSLITITITTFVLNGHYYKNIYTTRVIDAKFKIGENITVNPDPDYLDFGTVREGGSATRSIKLFHEYNESLKVIVSSSGKISRVLSYVPSFYIEPNVTKELVLTANSYGRNGESFSGKITILMVKDGKKEKI